MKMTPVKSNAIEAAGYEDGTLRLAYKGGREYDYEGVPPAEYAELLTSPSVGSFVNQRIKGAYPEHRR